jgi:kynurenine 3-monooxygenase
MTTAYTFKAKPKIRPLIFNKTKSSYQAYVSRISSVGGQKSSCLKGVSILIIGAGPAGLVLARAAANQGAVVQVLEKADDPRNDDTGYNNRSFNITLDDVGRMVLNDEKAWQGGNWIRGRAVHQANSKKVVYADYGPTEDDKLVSIPRPLLRQNLCNLAESAGARLSFNAKIESVDCDKGLVSYINNHGNVITARADLIAFCDGLNSLADQLIQQKHGATIDKWSEKRRYVSGMIDGSDNNRLNKNYMHFWHEMNGDRFTIGIPNADSSLACLLVDDNLNRPYSFSDSRAEIRKRLKHEYPSFSLSAPTIADTLPKGRHSHFWYKTISRYLVGSKGVIIGDAGCAFPPWAGYGANQSMFGAALLVDYLNRSPGKIQLALLNYQHQQLSLSSYLSAFVSKQGDFLSGPVAILPDERSDPALGPMIWRSYLATKQPLGQKYFNLSGRFNISNRSVRLKRTINN